MEVLFLVIVFAVIIGLLAIRRPLYQAILGGLVLLIILYKIPLLEAGGNVVSVVTSWVRHIPESILPTYTGVLLMLNISGVETSSYIIGMLIPVLVLMLIGYFACLRKIPKDPGIPESKNKKQDIMNLFKHLWSLMLIVLFILVFKMSVVMSVFIIIVACILVYRIKWSELKPMFASAFEKKLLLNTFFVLILKEFIAQTGVLQLLPDMMQKLPLPTYLIFALLFFVVTIVSGSGGAIAMGAPLAFAAMPVTTPLTVYLMCITHAASQIGPTHTCIMVAAEYYGITIGAMIRKTIPYALIFCAIMTLYYNIWILLF